MSQSGTHTWDLILDYCRCPKCGFIIESREGFHYQLGQWVKEVECTRCQHIFSVYQKRRPSFGPLIGNPQPIEIDWKL